MRLATLSVIVSVIAVILAFINLSMKYDKYLDYSNSKKNNTDDEEYDEDDDTFQKAIIFIGNEKIEIEVDYCYIDDSTTRIESKDGKVYLTDIKNVVLISDKKEIF
ncbi:TPA: hypothetical protein I9092_000912 [Clostridium perfringens]|uniref:Uncharacterized protein n=1 Tax=Clostridium perfringens E str. JGS1987 TaxID=451755 RepID=B1BPC4_CLOPF|nr:hypothetical protein [Clostridium perfringens]EDT16477.1 hypothetical protein AC3_0827 [Clostridium perfringens E str. JGS1987]HAT4335532.1 hypothetical protein [Clostridium perfringens]HAT4354700.1 hypothetical protein [Clostridium perfringens]HJF36447.1 hypothetical protein [Clostridium perfringens]